MVYMTWNYFYFLILTSVMENFKIKIVKILIFVINDMIVDVHNELILY